MPSIISFLEQTKSKEIPERETINLLERQFDSTPHLKKEHAEKILDWLNTNYIAISRALKDDYEEISTEPEPIKKAEYLLNLAEIAERELQIAKQICSRFPELPKTISNFWIHKSDFETLNIATYKKRIAETKKLAENNPAEFHKILPLYIRLAEFISTEDYEEASQIREKILELNPEFSDWPRIM